jgi:hypothetical protein
MSSLITPMPSYASASASELPTLDLEFEQQFFPALQRTSQSPLPQFGGSFLDRDDSPSISIPLGSDAAAFNASDESDYNTISHRRGGFGASKSFLAPEYLRVWLLYSEIFLSISSIKYFIHLIHMVGFTGMSTLTISSSQALKHDDLINLIFLVEFFFSRLLLWPN